MTGIIGGQSLQPRVIGGGLAALGMDERERAANNFSSNYAGIYGGSSPACFVGGSNGAPFGLSITADAFMSGGLIGSLSAGATSVDVGRTQSMQPAMRTLSPAPQAASIRSVAVPSQPPMPTRTVAPQQAQMFFSEPPSIQGLLSGVPLSGAPLKAKVLSGGIPAAATNSAPMMYEVDYAYAPMMTATQMVPTVPVVPSMIDGENIVASRIISRQEMAAVGHVVKPRAAATITPTASVRFDGGSVAPPAYPQTMMPTMAVAPVTRAPTAPRPATETLKCSILNIPDEYMSLISQEDLSQIQDITGATIQFSQPDPATGNHEWEIRLFGAEDSRRQGHEILENTLNERLGTTDVVENVEPDPSSSMAIPGDLMSFFTREDFQKIEEVTGCRVEVYEPATSGSDEDWQVTATGPLQAIQQAHEIIERTLQDRAAAAAPQEQFVEPQQPMETLPPNAYQPMETLPPNTYQPPMQTLPPSTYPAPAAAVPEQAVNGPPDNTAVSMPTTILPIPPEYIELLSQDDIDQLEQSIGCHIKIAEPEPGGTVWTLTLYGSAEQRETCHRCVEDLLTQRQDERSQGAETAMAVQGGIPTTIMTMDPAAMAETMAPPPPEEQSSGLVPCTVLPIPLQYLELLQNLDAICTDTGTEIKVSRPEVEGGDWQLSLFGAPEQRQRAHQCIEDTINAALDGEA